MPTLVEIKARCNKQAEIRALLRKNGGECKGIDHQIDTYFNTPNGRLKLREGSIENNLIQYNRPNQAGPKTSKVSLYPSTPNSALKTVLANSLGVLVVVDKKREIWFIDNVKFHLDVVENLGLFVEIEAIDDTDTVPETTLRKQCDHFMQLFDIQLVDLITNSYSDLILAQKG